MKSFLVHGSAMGGAIVLWLSGGTAAAAPLPLAEQESKSQTTVLLSSDPSAIVSTEEKIAAPAPLPKQEFAQESVALSQQAELTAKLEQHGASTLDSEPFANPVQSAAPESASLLSIAGAAAPEKPDGNRSQPESTPEEIEAQQRLDLLAEGDRLYVLGQIAEAEALYREAKGAGTLSPEELSIEAPYSDPDLLPPAAAVYWREAAAGEELGLLSRVMVPLQLLTTEYPAFIPGQLAYAEFLQEQEQVEEAIALLEEATTRYPEQVDLAQAQIDLLSEEEQWLEASLAARQFSVFNPSHPNAPEFQAFAEEAMDEFRADLHRNLTGNAIANVLTGALSYVLTGGLFGPLSALDTTILMLRGESEIGEAIANQAADYFDLIEDPVILEYINEIGHELANLAGRDGFDYDFYVVQDDSLNAFALPGGKIFIHTGAILATQSEAELAGLIAHEISHAVLSHGFEVVTSANLAANLLQPIPFGRIAANLFALNYSRDMERQADELGTQLLTAAGYAADGLENLMETLAAEPDRISIPEWLSTHPDTEERVNNIAEQIQFNGYNRYAYEGVDRHRKIQERLRLLLPDAAGGFGTEQSEKM